MGKSRKRTQLVSPAKPVSGARLNIPETTHLPFNEQPIMFSLECCGSKQCFNNVVAKPGKIGFAMRLHELSQLTWGQIKADDKKGLGYETLDMLAPKLHKLPPGSRVIGFRYHAYRRMFGYRDRGGVFHILGFDYDGKLYKHSK